MKEQKEKLYQGREVRSIVSVPSLNEESRIVEGYAILFNSRSQMMYDWYYDEIFVEEIAPEAITEEFLRSCDVKMLLEHNRSRLLARWNRGEGSLELSIDEKGVKYRFEAPKTNSGDEALEHIRRGDFAGSSFGFYAYSEGCINRYYDKEEDIWVHQIRKFDKIVDATITCDPAYLETTAEVRSVEDRAVVEQIRANQEAKKQAETEQKRSEELSKEYSEYRNRISNL